MKKTCVVLFTILSGWLLNTALVPNGPSKYLNYYSQKVSSFKIQQQALLDSVRKGITSADDLANLRNQITSNRRSLKEIDFWLRYFEPVAYKKINGPLPVEWETEVFEKFEAPYRREGAGLTLAYNYLGEANPNIDSLAILTSASIAAADVFLTDSITNNLRQHHHFFLANRLHLLNLAAIYTTGFECPDSDLVIPELQHMLESTYQLYRIYNNDFTQFQLTGEYLLLYKEMISFVADQPRDFTLFDHFSFIQQYVNPLYRLNQKLIVGYKVFSKNFNDYSLNRNANSIFDKALYRAQNAKGVFIGIDDEEQLNEIKAIGKLLFYDPILSKNNMRSCASCHNPAMSYTDTTTRTNLQFDGISYLTRNTPSLINVIHNHLLMLDGKHFNLENQTIDVLTNPKEMASTADEIVKKVMSCNDYKTVFKKYLKATPQFTSVNTEHIASAIILYYSDFSFYNSPFDIAMTENKPVNQDVQKGFNLFMSKAKCGTCHFVPQFNGNKPPYISSEFEVLGTPADVSFKNLSTDKGRALINPAKEMADAFRTGTVRNSGITKPYMHNGVFTTLEEVIDFYDAGGGSGRGLPVANQTLPNDSLRLSVQEKKELIAFLNALNEAIPLQTAPVKLPGTRISALNTRKIGGQY